ncbi:hypothetical protein F5I97DRAFT_433960 [Phlebopus sp. FC_14]|nr:hypothetical protein F5I97DRAFT_433960 [Phlebopus sp. FC_14]
MSSSDEIQSPSSMAKAIRDIKNHCLASLVFLVWDILVTYEVEVEYIWPKPRRSFFKWLFFYLRYFNLFCQIWHQIAIQSLTSGQSSMCKAWFIYSTVVSQASFTAIEVILAARVFALFNKSYRVAYCLAILITGEVATMAINAAHTIPLMPQDGVCVVMKPPKEIMNYSILLGFIVFKHVVAVRAGWGRTPIVLLIIRDSTSVYVVMIVLTGFILAHCELQDDCTIVMFFWLMSISSASGCRLIINMQQLASITSKRHGTPGLFTTDLEVEMSCRTMSMVA